MALKTILLSFRRVFLLCASFIILLVASSCETDPPLFPVGEVMGYKPLYASDFVDTDVRVIEPQPINNPGKIYYYGSYLFLNEGGYGVHLINNVDPSNPRQVGFIKIPGVGDVAIRENMMFANSFRDLVTIDLSDLANIREVGRLEDVFPDAPSNLVPPDRGYFECVDTEKGRVLGWGYQLLDNPKCFR